MTELLYLDSSAIVKLVAREPETDALRSAIRGQKTVTSALARVEIPRAVARVADAKMVRRAHDVLAAIALLRLDDVVLDVAASLAPASLRWLDALHLASALSIKGDLNAIVTYDEPLADAARAAGLDVRAPRDARA